MTRWKIPRHQQPWATCTASVLGDGFGLCLIALFFAVEESKEAEPDSCKTSSKSAERQA